MYYDEDALDPELISVLLQSYTELVKNGYSSRFLEPEDYDILLNYFVNQNDTNKALEICETAFTYHNATSEFLEVKSEILYDAKRYNQTLQEIDRIAVYNNNVLPLNSLILKSNILVEQDKIDEAIYLLNAELINYRETDMCNILHELALIYDDILNFQAVYDTLERILAINPLDDEALHKFAYWAELADKNEECEILHKRLIEHYPMNSIMWYNLGSVQHNQKKYDEAIVSYQYAIALEDKLESAYRNLADIYMKKRQYDKAIEVLNDHLHIGKPEDIVYEALGDCYSKKKNFEQARSYFIKATNLNPNDDALFFKVAQTYVKENKYQQAIVAYQSAYRLNPENHTYPFAIANAMVLVQDYKEAFNYFYITLKLKPNYKPAWVNLIRLMYELELYEEAIEQLIYAYEHCGDKPEFFMLEVANNIEMGRIKEALSCLNYAFENDCAKFNFLEELQPDILKRKQFAKLYNQYKQK